MRNGRLGLCRVAAVVLVVSASVSVLGCASRGPVMAASGRLVEPDSMRELAAEPRPHSHGLLERRRLDTGGLVDARAQMQRRVTLERLLAIAATKQPELRRAKAELIAAEARHAQAGALPNPSLTLEARRLPVTAGTSLLDTNWRAWWRQPLPVTGRESARREHTEQARLAAVERTLVAGLELELAVRLGFVDYWGAYRRHEKLGEAFALRERAFQRVQEAYEAGEIAQLELVRAERDLGEAQLDLYEARRELTEATEALRKAVGDGTLPLGSPPEAWTWAEASPGDWPLPSREWVVRHPKVRARAHDAEAAKRDPSEHGRYERDVALRLGYEYEGRGQRHWLNAGLELTLPFFDRGAPAERAVSAQAQAELATRDGAIVELLARLGRLREAYHNARQQLKVYETSLLPGARTEYEALNELHAEQEGEDQAPVREVLEAKAALLELEAQAWQSRVSVARLHEELTVLTLKRRE